MKESPTYNSISLAELRRIARLHGCGSGHIRLALACRENRGVRLTAEEVESLVMGDEAVEAAINFMVESMLEVQP